ncbi:MAG: hypothetical protein ACJ8F7_18475 [Gemmataceae bacterium]
MTIWMRSFTAFSAVVAVAIVGTEPASAQFPPPGPGTTPANPPVVSPYLNLLRRGSSAGVNYYGLVKPDMEFRNAYRGLQQQLNLQQNANQQIDQQTGLPYTGHAAVFLNTGGYFLNSTPATGMGQLSTRPGVGQARPGGAAGGGPPTRGGGTPRH